MVIFLYFKMIESIVFIWIIKNYIYNLSINFEPRTERLCIYCPYCYNRPANVSKFCLKEACYGKGGASGAVYRRDTYGRKHIAGTGRREENLFRTGNGEDPCD